MRGHDSFAYSSLAATSSDKFELKGGVYVVDAIATWNSGSITLQRLGPDANTYLTAITALSADGSSAATALPPGQYKLLVTSATNLFVAVLPVPGE